MRGFVITILSIGIIVMLIMLAMSLHNIQVSTERALIEPLPLIYAAYLLDDVAYELNSILGPQTVLNQKNDSMEIMIMDRIHTYNHSTELLAYEEFLINEVARSTTSNITANFTNLTGGVITLFINEDYIYSNDHIDRELLFTRAGGTGASSYGVNFTITAIRSNITHMAFDENGTINVTIRCTDLNGTNVEQGKIFPNQANTFKVEYLDGSSVIVTMGLVNGNNGSLKLKSGINTDVSWATVLPPIDADKKMGYEYDATITYLQGKVAKHSRIGK